MLDGGRESFTGTEPSADTPSGCPPLGVPPVTASRLGEKEGGRRVVVVGWGRWAGDMMGPAMRP